jgi:N-terminal acetyltransferase B complex catalytic subunit
MTTIRRFVCDDLFRFNNVNLDVLTETARACATQPRARSHEPAQYGVTFYLQYLAKWPEYFLFAEGPGGACQGYSAIPGTFGDRRLTRVLPA